MARTGLATALVLAWLGAAPCVSAEPADPRFRAMALMTLGKHGEACALLAQHFPPDTDDTDALYLMGQCRAGQGDHSGAQAAFERVIALDPEAHRVRLALATSYGASGDTRAARDTYRSALQAGPPDNVAAGIEASIDALLAAKPWYLTTFAGAVFDSNVRSGPDTRTISAYGLPFELDDGSLAEEAYGMRMGATAGHAFDRDAPWSLVLQGQALRLDYEGAAYDADTLSLAAGPIYRSGQQRLALLPRATLQTFGTQIYRTAFGLDFDGRRGLTERLQFDLSSGIQSSTYHTAEDRDGWEIYGLAGLGYQWPQARLGAGYLASEETAEAELYSNRTQGPRVTFDARLSADLTLGLAYQHTDRDYEAVSAAFGSRRRDDVDAFQARLSQRLLRRFVDGLAVEASYDFTDQESNHASSAFERQIVTLGLSKRW